jgi:hypothetical protein
MGGRTGRRKGTKNYKNEVLICCVLDIMPNGKYGWQAVALAYQEAAQEDEVRNTDDLKKHWKSGIFWPRERERRQNNILVPQHVDTFTPRTILTNFGACSSQIWSKKSLNFWGINDRPILGATQ